MLPTSQVLRFTDKNLYNNNYKLFELDKNTLDILQSGQSLHITGDDDEDAVLCTENQTYDLLETETSNTLMLVNNLQFFDDLKDVTERSVSKVTASGIYHEYLEVFPGKPPLKKLNELLNRTAYKGPEHEYAIKQEDLFTFDELLGQIQSSREELKLALKKKIVVTINGYLRLLDFSYHYRVLNLMLQLINENSWDLDEIHFEETLSTLSNLVPREILCGVFDIYAEESKVIDGTQLYQYKEREVCRFFAQIILSDAAKFNLDDFLQSWKESVPDGVIATEDMLHGLVIINRNSIPKMIKLFLEEDLPDDVTERFKVLFYMKQKWTLAEISPYIE